MDLYINCYRSNACCACHDNSLNFIACFLLISAIFINFLYFLFFMMFSGVLMMMAMVLLLGQQASAFSAATSNSNNSSNLATHCGASTMEECLVDIGHADHVFFAEPETSLQKVTPKFIDVSKNNLITPNDKCGRPRPGQPYNPCVPDPNDSKKG
ncbi:hypothetical protein J1N35_002361 [Gossypium stocksii]|uniref:Uncharacterized protein n=1 Tax=Gossypium stocksii TaxID=47602 RepID=A0A9D4AND7_9ROSI|nr:hypothetical protein J1N35_002361 [Gossypium stocksii]